MECNLRNAMLQIKISPIVSPLNFRAYIEYDFAIFAIDIAF